MLFEWRHVKFEVVVWSVQTDYVLKVFFKSRWKSLKIQWGNVNEWMKLTIKDRFSAWYYDNFVQTTVSILMSGDGAG